MKKRRISALLAAGCAAILAPNAANATDYNTDTTIEVPENGMTFKTINVTGTESSSTTLTIDMNNDNASFTAAEGEGAVTLNGYSTIELSPAVYEVTFDTTTATGANNVIIQTGKNIGETDPAVTTLGDTAIKQGSSLTITNNVGGENNSVNNIDVGNITLGTATTEDPGAPTGNSTLNITGDSIVTATGISVTGTGNTLSVTNTAYTADSLSGIELEDDAGITLSGINEEITIATGNSIILNNSVLNNGIQIDESDILNVSTTGTGDASEINGITFASGTDSEHPTTLNLNISTSQLNVTAASEDDPSVVMNGDNKITVSGDANLEFTNGITVSDTGNIITKDNGSSGITNLNTVTVEDSTVLILENNSETENSLQVSSAVLNGEADLTLNGANVSIAKVEVTGSDAKFTNSTTDDAAYDVELSDGSSLAVTGKVAEVTLINPDEDTYATAGLTMNGSNIDSTTLTEGQNLTITSTTGTNSIADVTLNKGTNEDQTTLTLNANGAALTVANQATMQGNAELNLKGTNSITFTNGLNVSDTNNVIQKDGGLTNTANLGQIYIENGSLELANDATAAAYVLSATSASLNGDSTLTLSTGNISITGGVNVSGTENTVDAHNNSLGGISMEEGAGVTIKNANETVNRTGNGSNTIALSNSTISAQTVASGKTLSLSTTDSTTQQSTVKGVSLTAGTDATHKTTLALNADTAKLVIGSTTDNTKATVNGNSEITIAGSKEIEFVNGVTANGAGNLITKDGTASGGTNLHALTVSSDAGMTITNNSTSSGISASSATLAGNSSLTLAGDGGVAITDGITVTGTGNTLNNSKDNAVKLNNGSALTISGGGSQAVTLINPDATTYAAANLTLNGNTVSSATLTKNQNLTITSGGGENTVTAVSLAQGDSSTQKTQLTLNADSNNLNVANQVVMNGNTDLNLQGANTVTLTGGVNTKSTDNTINLSGGVARTISSVSMDNASGLTLNTETAADTVTVSSANLNASTLNLSGSGTMGVTAVTMTENSTGSKIASTGSGTKNLETVIYNNTATDSQVLNTSGDMSIGTVAQSGVNTLTHNGSSGDTGNLQIDTLNLADNVAFVLNSSAESVTVGNVTNTHTVAEETTTGASNLTLNADGGTIGVTNQVALANGSVLTTSGANDIFTNGLSTAGTTAINAGNTGSNSTLGSLNVGANGTTTLNATAATKIGATTLGAGTGSNKTTLTLNATGGNITGSTVALQGKGKLAATGTNAVTLTGTDAGINISGAENEISAASGSGTSLGTISFTADNASVTVSGLTAGTSGNFSGIADINNTGVGITSDAGNGNTQALGNININSEKNLTVTGTSGATTLSAGVKDTTDTGVGANSTLTIERNNGNVTLSSVILNGSKDSTTGSTLEFTKSNDATGTINTISSLHTTKGENANGYNNTVKNNSGATVTISDTTFGNNSDVLNLVANDNNVAGSNIAMETITQKATNTVNTSGSGDVTLDNLVLNGAYISTTTATINANPFTLNSNTKGTTYITDVTKTGKVTTGGVTRTNLMNLVLNAEEGSTIQSSGSNISTLNTGDKLTLSGAGKITLNNSNGITINGGVLANANTNSESSVGKITIAGDFATQGVNATSTQNSVTNVDSLNITDGVTWTANYSEATQKVDTIHVATPSTEANPTKMNFLLAKPLGKTTDKYIQYVQVIDGETKSRLNSTGTASDDYIAQVSGYTSGNTTSYSYIDGSANYLPNRVRITNYNIKEKVLDYLTQEGVRTYTMADDGDASGKIDTKTYAGGTTGNTLSELPNMQANSGFTSNELTYNGLGTLTGYTEGSTTVKTQMFTVDATADNVARTLNINGLTMSDALSDKTDTTKNNTGNGAVINVSSNSVSGNAVVNLAAVNKTYNISGTTDTGRATSHPVFKDNIVIGDGTAATGNGGAIYSSGANTTVKSVDSNIDPTTGLPYVAVKDLNLKFENNSASNNGGAIYNTDGATVSLKNSNTFTGNSAGTSGGAIYNTNASLTLGDTDTTTTFSSNKANGGSGGAVASVSNDAEFLGTQVFDSNTATDNGGAYSAVDSTVTFTGNQTFTNNSADGYGGAIYAKGNATSSPKATVINITANSGNTTFSGNTHKKGGSSAESNAIYLDGDATINLVTTGSNEIIFNDKITSGTSTTNNKITQAGNVRYNTDMSAYAGSFDLTSGTAYFTDANSVPFSGDYKLAGGSTLDLRNGTAKAFNATSLDLSGTSESNPAIMNIDLDLTSVVKDAVTGEVTGTADSFVLPSSTGGGYINVDKINFIGSDSTNSEQIFYNIADGANVSSTQKRAVSSLYDYDILGYNSTGGRQSGLLLKRNSISPALFGPQIAANARLAGQLALFNDMLHRTDEIAENRYFHKVSKENLYAADPDVKDDRRIDNGYTPYVNQQDGGNTWMKPSFTLESISPKGHKKYTNRSYNTILGYEMPVATLRSGWDLINTVFAGYQGSYQSWDNAHNYQNGGSAGYMANLYKKNFFAGGVVMLGASAVQTTDKSSFNRDINFGLFDVGASARVGYNVGMGKHWLFQPMFTTSYIFISGIDRHNHAGQKIHMKGTNTLQIAPGFKIVGNYNGWQPYLLFDYTWPFIAKTVANVNAVGLPNLKLRSYVEYGVGLRKNIGERFEGYAEALMRNVGRTGVTLQTGLIFRF